MTLSHLPVTSDLPVNTFTMKQPLAAKVIANERLSASHRAPLVETRHIVIHCPGMRYVAGQSIGVLPPGIDPRTNRKYSLRLYSVASCGRGDDRKGDSVSLVIARHYWQDPQTGQQNIPGVCSHYLCDAKPGDELLITGPVGKRFLLPEDFMARDFVFVATGTGIAPFRAMLHDMVDAGYFEQDATDAASQTRRATLVLGVPYEDSILYDNELRAWAGKYSRFTYATAISRGGQTNAYSDIFPTHNNKVYAHIALWDQRDVVTQSILKPGTVVYYCGLRGMESGIEAVLNKMGQAAGQDDLVKQMTSEGRLLREVY